MKAEHSSVPKFYVRFTILNCPRITLDVIQRAVNFAESSKPNLSSSYVSLCYT